MYTATTKYYRWLLLQVTCAGDAVNTRPMVLNNCPGASFHCQDVCHFQDHVLWRRPSTQLASQLDSNHLSTTTTTLASTTTTLVLQILPVQLQLYFFNVWPRLVARLTPYLSGSDSVSFSPTLCAL